MLFTMQFARSLIPGMAPVKPIVASLPGYSPFESHQCDDITLTRVTPLIFMVLNGHMYNTVSISEFIKTHPRQLNMRNEQGYNPLSAACFGYPKRTSLDVIKLLLESGVEIGTQFEESCSFDPKPPLNQLLIALDASDPQPALIRVLIEYSKQLITDYDTNQRVLMEAIDTKSTEIMSLFLDAGFDVNSVRGSSLLIRAIYNRDTPMVRLLLDQGADPNRAVKSGGDHRTAFTVLARMGDTTVSREMLEILFDEPGRAVEVDAPIESVV